jgi:dTDP-4-dehydrorhamnose reductase
MRVLITGANGLLGSNLLKTANPDDTIYSKRFDILDKDAAYAAFDEAKPDVVIHCAGEGRVDFAETNRCAAWRSTFEGCETVLRASHYWGAHFVYISTNAVYNGKQSPCNEDTLHDPVNAYGKYKSTCEDAVRAYAYKKTIIRPIMLYGWPKLGRRDNMVTRIIKDLRTADLKSFGQIPVDNEIISQPTYVRDCAEAIWKIIEMQVEGYDEFNVAALEKTTLFKFAVQIAKTFDLDPGLLVPVQSSEIKVAARRPRDTTFGLEKLHSRGIVLRNQEEGLLAMKRELE